MKFVKLFLSSLFFITISHADMIEEWNQTFGGTLQDIAYSVQQTADGGYILAGKTNSFGSGEYDAWLIKTDANGTEEWNQTFGGTSQDMAYSVQQAFDGGYILAGEARSIGTIYNDAWLIKTDATGTEEWSQTFGGTSSEIGHSVQQTSDGGYILAGTTHSFGNGGNDAWLIKTDANGTEEWSQTFGGTSDDRAVFVQQTYDDGYILAGYTNSFGSGEYDAWLIKTDANGTEEWNQTFGGADFEMAYSTQQTSDGGYILAGYTESFGNGSNDAWLIKTDANGTEEWNQTFGGTSSEKAYSVQQASDGGYILSGETSSFGDFYNEAWLIKTDTTGTEEWSQTFGGSSEDMAWSVQQTSDDGYVLGGYTFSFGGGDGDAWLIKVRNPNYGDQDLVINEILNNPSIVGDSEGEWIEIYNPNEEIVDLEGWTVSDLGSDLLVIDQEIAISPYGYVIIGPNSDMVSNGGVWVDYQYTNFTLGNSSDEIILRNPDGVVVDSVAWDGGPNFPDPNGASMALIDPTLDNGIGSNWAESSTPFGLGDLGTPGLPNFLSSIVIDPMVLEFDTVFVAESGELSLTISNDGNAPLLIDSIYTTSTLFNVSFTDTLIETTAELQVMFTPTEFGDIAGSLYISSNDPDESSVEIPLSGFGYYLSPDIELESSSIDFGGVMDGLTGVEVFHIYNIGEGVLDLDSIYCTQNFSVSETNGSVAPGESLALEVSFSPDDETAFSGVLTIVAGNDPDEDTLVVNLSGVGTAQAPIMTISENELYFGVVVPNQTVTRHITIYNEGMLDLEIEELTMSGSDLFTTTFSDASIAPGDFVEVEFQFSSPVNLTAVEETAIIIAAGVENQTVLLTAGYYGPVWHVDTNGDDTTGDGSGGNPFASIQTGIDIAEPGDSVQISPGTYVENIIISGKNLIVGSLQLWTQDTSYISQTIIDGGGANGTGTVVIFDNNIDTTCVLSGVTIANGYEVSVQGGPLGFAGGIDCIGSNPTLSNLIIRDNYVDGNGGGIQLSGSNPIIKSVVIQNNTGLSGGGGILCTGGSSPFLTNVQIIGNDGGNDGGGLYLTAGSSPTLKDVIIANNTANSGGGLLCRDNNVIPMLDNVTITNNIGGGIHCIAYAQPTLINSIVWGNTPTNISGDPSLLADYCDIESGWEGISNIDANPRFCDPEAGDFQLAESSPCIGSGIDGSDMGAYGVGCTEAVSIAVDMIPSSFSLQQNYPNPFNPSTTIRYGLPEEANVSLVIYDVRGQVIQTIASEHQSAGWYDVVWNGQTTDGKTISTGIYFTRLVAGEYSQVVKMLYLK